MAKAKVLLKAKTIGAEILADRLDTIRPGIRRELNAVRRQSAEMIASDARGNMRVGPGPIPNAKHPDDHLPHIRDTIMAEPRGVVVRHPAGALWEYGGTIAPRGSSITFPRLGMVARALESNRSEVERLMADRIDQLMRGAG